MSLTALRQKISGHCGLAVVAVGLALRDYRKGDVMAGIWLAASGWLGALCAAFDMQMPEMEVVKVDREDMQRWFSGLTHMEREEWASDIRLAQEVIDTCPYPASEVEVSNE